VANTERVPRETAGRGAAGVGGAVQPALFDDEVVTRTGMMAGGPAEQPAASKRPARPKNVHRVKVTLRGTKPPIWRRFEVPSDITLARLHDVIQLGFGWQDYHMWVFETAVGSYGIADEELGYRSAANKRLSAVADWPRDRIRYTYDFGDYWEHDVLLETTVPAIPGIGYPRCTGGRRACPPEDCGGVWGYRELLKTLANPRSEGHAAMLGWLGLESAADFDPESFDVESVNDDLDQISRVLIKL